jgi:hypothetical protein
MNSLGLVGEGRAALRLLAKNDNAVFLINRSVCFASKPAPTGFNVEAQAHG